MIFSSNNQLPPEPGQYIVTNLYFNVLQANVMYSSHKQPPCEPDQYSNTFVFQCILRKCNIFLPQATTLWTWPIHCNIPMYNVHCHDLLCFPPTIKATIFTELLNLTYIPYIPIHLHFNGFQANVIFSSHNQPPPEPGQYSNTFVLQCIRIQPSQYSNEYYVTTLYFYNYILLVRFPETQESCGTWQPSKSIDNTFQFILQADILYIYQI